MLYSWRFRHHRAKLNSKMITYHQHFAYTSCLYMRQQRFLTKVEVLFYDIKIAIFISLMDWFHLAAPKPVGKHEFSDILDAQGFKPTSDQESQTLSSLKKEQNKPEDPIKAKVNYKNDFTHLVWLPWRIYFLITKFIEKIACQRKIITSLQETLMKPLLISCALVLWLFLRSYWKKMISWTIFFLILFCNAL